MLSEDEKKAIELIKQYRKEIKDGDIKPIFILDTAINLITKLQKEIEHQKEKRENQKVELTILNEKQKEMNKLTNTVSSYKGMFKKLQKENKEKDKQIDLMINFMYETWCKYPGTISHALRRNGFNDDECGTCENTDKNCVKCIKQYFERKSEKWKKR